MKILAPAILLFFLLPAAPAPAEADTSVRLKVSATIPPRPCNVDNDDCEDADANLAASAEQTRVIVKNSDILYVGSPPQVTEQGDLLTVIF